MSTRNPQAIIARRWLFATAVAAFGVVLPSLTGMDGPNGGFALAFVSGFVAIGAAIGAWIYFQRAAALKRLFEGDDLIAHWTYSATQGARFAAAQYTRELGDRRLMFIVICAIALPTGLLFVALDPHKIGPWVLGVMVALCALIWALTRILARGSAARAQVPPETWVGPNAVWVAGVLHTWGSMSARLESATAVQEEQDLELELVYSFRARHGRQSTTVRIPVPAGQEREAASVLAVLNAEVKAES